MRRAAHYLVQAEFAVRSHMETDRKGAAIRRSVCPPHLQCAARLFHVQGTDLCARLERVCKNSLPTLEFREFW